MKWTLTSLYSGFLDPKFKSDQDHLTKTIESLKTWASTGLSGSDPVPTIREFLDQQTQITDLSERLYGFCQLTLAVDVDHTQAKQCLDQIQVALTDLAGPTSAFFLWLKTVPQLETLIQDNPELETHRFYLLEHQTQANYLLTEAEESVIATMQLTGSTAMSQFHDELVASHMVDIDLPDKPKQMPLEGIRNLAYEADVNTRKTGFDAEINAYPQIARASAASLNSIKGEAINLGQKRGYKSPLDQALIYARLERPALDCLMAAVKQSLPNFQHYLKNKASHLGHPKGLPFYDLFAPIGQSQKRFGLDEGRDIIDQAFSQFSPDLVDLTHQIFDQNWMDTDIRPGKIGGGFCYPLPAIGESRILVNFTGSLTDVLTIAHEIGHAYHNHCLIQEDPLNRDYPMPIAETASTFCENMVLQYALNTLPESEQTYIIEQNLANATQIVVDIYSRYVFETAVFDARKQGPLSVNTLKDFMIDAQKAAYGDGLDPAYLHPFMWIPKPHYYMPSTHFYNFPYTFGYLFAQGLYAKWKREGTVFVPKYKALLAMTGRASLQDCAEAVGTSLTDSDFWTTGLEGIFKGSDPFA